MAALIGGGIGDADDPDTSSAADSVAGRRPVGNMTTLPGGIRFFKSGPLKKKFKKSSILIIFTFDFGLQLSALRILAHTYRYLRLFYSVYRNISS